MPIVKVEVDGESKVRLGRGRIYMNFLAIYGVISLSAQHVNRFNRVHYDVRKEETSSYAPITTLL
jgi:hypothetical protein